MLYRRAKIFSLARCTGSTMKIDALMVRNLAPEKLRLYNQSQLRFNRNKVSKAAHARAATAFLQSKTKMLD
jgi:hypothetical protein